MFVNSLSSAGPLNHSLSALLGRLGVSQPIAGRSDNNHGDSDDSGVPLGTPASAAASNALRGASKAAISDQLLALFTGLQQKSGSEIANTTGAAQAFEPASHQASTLINGSSPLLTLLATFQRNVTPAGSTTDITV